MLISMNIGIVRTSVGIVRNFLPCQLPVHITCFRRYHILKRRVPPELRYKYIEKWPAMHDENYIYDILRETSIEKRPGLNIIVMANVTGIGRPGDVVNIKESVARRLLLSRKAVYATDENLRKYSLEKAEQRENTSGFSSPFVEQALNHCRRNLFRLFMSPYNPWTIEPWHLRMSLRRSFLHVPLESIKVPEEGPISGPSDELWDKDFYIEAKINGQDPVKMRFRIEKWENDPFRRKFPLPGEMPWFRPSVPVFPSQADVIAQMHREAVESYFKFKDTIPEEYLPTNPSVDATT